MTTRKFANDAMNAQIVKDIDKLVDHAERRINPQNIFYFDGDDVDLLRGAKLFDQDLAYNWDNSATINSYSCGKVNGMIRYLKTNKTIFITQDFKFTPWDFSQDDKVNYEHTIKVPEFYDGRNAFVKYKEAKDYEDGGQSMTPARGRPFSIWATKMNSDAKNTTKLLVTYNPDEVIISVRFDRADPQDGSNFKKGQSDIEGTVYFWRDL